MPDMPLPAEPDISSPADLLGELHGILGPRGLLTDASALAAAGQDWRRLFDHPPLAVLRPAVRR